MNRNRVCMFITLGGERKGKHDLVDLRGRGSERILGWVFPPARVFLLIECIVYTCTSEQHVVSHSQSFSTLSFTWVGITWVWISNTVFHDAGYVPLLLIVECTKESKQATIKRKFITSKEKKKKSFLMSRQSEKYALTHVCKE